MTDLIVPNLTSFTTDSRLDSKKTRRHADYLLANGVDYLLLAGTTGLGPSLSFEEKVAMLNLFQDIPDKVIMQVSSLSLEDSKNLAREAKASGIKAIASLPPYYYPRMPEEWYVRFYHDISEIYPTLVYNFPLTTNYDVLPGVVRTVNRRGGDLIGIKDTTPDLAHMLNFKYEFPNDFKVYCGPDPLILPSIRSGLDGAVAGTGNYLPTLIRSVFDKRDEPTAMELQKKVTSIGKLSQKYGQWAANYSLTHILLGYEVGMPRAPLYPLSHEQEGELEGEVRKILKGGD